MMMSSRPSSCPSSHPFEMAPAGPLPPSCGSVPPLPAPAPMQPDDWAALLEAVTARLQRLVDGGDSVKAAGALGYGPLQECIDALRQLQGSLRAGKP